LFEVDQRLSRLENDWSGLRGLLAQIDSLREAAQLAGQDLPQVEEDLRQVREILSSSAVAADGLDLAAQTAARALMLLHEALPPVLEQELVRQADQLAGYPKDLEGARHARGLHAEASRHLRRGRLGDASLRLKELRQALKEIGASPSFASVPDPLAPSPAPAEGPSAAAAAAANDDGSTDFLGRLLSKARGLAARVRNLPPDSEVAFEAAAEIRRATEFLRARKLDEAESTLTRLMRTLDAEHPAEA
ncbi:MAG: hypothetical protein L3J96_06055, partial [Thermoplasmata archaeon]|nr:hypothetical protein [Thermoplasmata archaeon]